MAYSFNGTNQYLQATLASGITAPFSMCVWANLANATANHFLVCVSDTNSPTDRHTLIARGNVAGDPVDAGSVTDDGDPPTTGESRYGTFLANTWFHVGGVWSAANSRTVYLDGVAGTANTVNVPITGITNLVIGAAWAANAPAVYANGLLAEVAIWSAALTAAQMASLAKGFVPPSVRRSSLVFYAPLLRTLQDIKGGISITNNNTATVANHPRVYA